MKNCEQHELRVVINTACSPGTQCCTQLRLDGLTCAQEQSLPAPGRPMITHQDSGTCVVHRCIPCPCHCGWRQEAGSPYTHTPVSSLSAPYYTPINLCPCGHRAVHLVLANNRLTTMPAASFWEYTISGNAIVRMPILNSMMLSHLWFDIRCETRQHAGQAPSASCVESKPGNGHTRFLVWVFETGAKVMQVKRGHFAPRWYEWHRRNPSHATMGWQGSAGHWHHMSIP